MESSGCQSPGFRRAAARTGQPWVLVRCLCESLLPDAASSVHAAAPGRNLQTRSAAEIRPERHLNADLKPIESWSWSLAGSIHLLDLKFHIVDLQFHIVDLQVHVVDLQFHTVDLQFRVAGLAL